MSYGRMRAIIDIPEYVPDRSPNPQRPGVFGSYLHPGIVGNQEGDSP